MPADPEAAGIFSLAHPINTPPPLVCGGRSFLSIHSQEERNKRAAVISGRWIVYKPWKPKNKPMYP